MILKRDIKHVFSGKVTVQDIANVIDHSLLRPDITVKELIEGCDIAKKYRCVSVCVRPSDLPIVMRELDGTDVLPTTVCAFPHGVTTTEAKIFEAEDSCDKGAVEVDMVMNYARLLSGEYDYVKDEITRVANAVHAKGALLKVIFENHYLDEEHMRKACEILNETGANYAKTSTGYAPTGSKVEDVAFMRAHCKPEIFVKAAGGIRTLDQVLATMQAGAVRCGTRGTVAILEEAIAREKNGTLAFAEK